MEDAGADVFSPFPALAGMNRLKSRLKALDIPVPRARGDEPAAKLYETREAFRSPRSRG